MWHHTPGLITELECEMSHFVARTIQSISIHKRDIITYFTFYTNVSHLIIY